ncbi:RHS repeat-associated core domain-containing protein [Bacillus thuringiensis]|nr:RHS repeat-associated core domain-containing protein [Bacillus thuringiensis]
MYVYNKDGVRLAMTNKDGQIVASYEYDSWGNVLKSDAKGIAADNPFGYAGYMYEKEIGMYYLIARYYNPEHGVFLSVDPDPGDEDDPVTMNGYTYADNNPVMLTDPDGHFAWMALNAGFAAYDGYKAYKKNGWKAAAVAVGAGLVGGAAYKGAKLAYNTFKYGTKLKFTNITTKKSKPNFQANISLRQLHNRLGKAGWNQETFYKNGLQIRNFTKNGRKITTRDGSSGGFNTADYYPRGKKKKNNVIKFRLKGKGKKVEKNR